MGKSVGYSPSFNDTSMPSIGFINKEDLKEKTNIPIIKIHEYLKKYNEEIYFTNLKIVKEYIKYKKSDAYKSNLLLERLGFDHFKTEITDERDLYLTAKKIVKTFDYYKKNYPTMHFIYSIPEIDNYQHRNIEEYSEILPYEDLVTINKNVDNINKSDVKITIDFVSRNSRKTLKSVSIFKRGLNFKEILKENGIDIKTTKATYANILTKETCDVIGIKYPSDLFFYIRSHKDTCLSKDNTFNNYVESYDDMFDDNYGHSNGKVPNHCESIFLKKVNNGYLITNIIGNNGNLSFENFKSIMEEQEDKEMNFTDADFDNHYYDTNGYNSSSGLKPALDIGLKMPLIPQSRII